MLKDPRWKNQNNVAIAKWVGVTEGYVRKVKNEAGKADKPDDKTTRTGTNSRPFQSKNADSAKNGEKKETEKSQEPEPKKLLDSVGGDNPHLDKK